MAKKQITKISELKFDKNNSNKGTQYGDSLLTKSIQQFGFREAATLDKNGVLIGGNKRIAKAGELGFENIEVIKGDPKKAYAIQYMDVDMTTVEGQTMALALNSSAKANIIFDAEVLEATVGTAIAEEWGVEKYDPQNKEKEIDNSISTEHECPSCGYKY